MTVEMLQTLSLVAYIAAGAFFLVGIALFFLLDIPRVFGDVTGRTAKKAIDSIRQKNEITGNKAYKPSPVNAARGKLTDEISPSGRLVKSREPLGGAPSTERIGKPGIVQQSGETTILDETADGTPQISNETTVLSAQQQPARQAAAPHTELEQQKTENESTCETFHIDVELGFTGSAEIIE